MLGLKHTAPENCIIYKNLFAQGPLRRVEMEWRWVLFSSSLFLPRAFHCMCFSPCHWTFRVGCVLFCAACTLLCQWFQSGQTLVQNILYNLCIGVLCLYFVAYIFLRNLYSLFWTTYLVYWLIRYGVFTEIHISKWKYTVNWFDLLKPLCLLSEYSHNCARLNSLHV